MIKIKLKHEHEYRRVTMGMTGRPLPLNQTVNIEYIVLTGDELEQVKSMFCTYPQPIPRGSEVYIFGDFAQTIVANFKGI